MSDIKALLAKDQNEREALLQTYYKLCDARDEIYAKAKPAEQALAKACLETIKAREKEMALAAEVESIWGPDWIALKKRIAELAGILKKIPHRK